MTKENISWAEKSFKLLVVFISLFLGFIGFDLYVEKKISDKLKDYEIIQQIASLVRPSLIFNQNDNYIHDTGGEQFIRNIHVEMTTPKNPKRTPEPNKILIYPHKKLKEPLILECLNRDMSFKCKPVNTIDWECEAYAPEYLEATDSKFTGEWLFRLEVIP